MIVDGATLEQIEETWFPAQPSDKLPDQSKEELEREESSKLAEALKNLKGYEAWGAAGGSAGAVYGGQGQGQWIQAPYFENQVQPVYHGTGGVGQFFIPNVTYTTGQSAVTFTTTTTSYIPDVPDDVPIDFEEGNGTEAA